MKSYCDKALKTFDDKQLRDLAGNAMSTTVVAAVFLSCFLNCELVVDGPGAKRMASADVSEGNDNQRMRFSV